MAKRNGGRRAGRQGKRGQARSSGKRRPTRRAASHGRKTAPRRRQARAGRRKTGKAGARARTSRRARRPSAPKEGRAAKTPRLDRVRRTLDEVVPTPPSSLNLDRRGSAARTGRAEIAESLQEHPGITPALTGGDVDANWENAYFSGDEAPGGDNPTPDQDVVDEIGRALGVEYHDSEELRSSDKLSDRDKHRWELDPASSEDYKDRT